MRRSLVFVSVVAAVLVATVAPATASVPLVADSVTYQQNPAHDGRVREQGLDPPFQVAWSVPMQTPSYPLIADGRVIVTTRRNGGGYGTRIRAIDIATGTTAWAHALRGSYYWSNAAYDGGRVFVVNFDGRLTAFDAATGVKVWGEHLPGQYAFSAPPTATDGTVYVGGAGSGGTLYAVAGSDGSILWTKAVENGDISSPTLSGKRVFVTYACLRTFAFARSTGKALWDYDTGCSGGGGRTSPYHQGLLYARDDPFSSNVVLDGQDGTKVADFAADRIPAFTTKLMIALTGGEVTATYLASGKVAWSMPLDGNVVSAPIVVNDSVIVASSDGTVWALRKANGTVRSSLELGIAIAGPDEQNVSQPLTGLGAGNGVVVIPGVDRLVALRPA